MTGCPHGMGVPAACLDCMEEGNLPVPKAERAATEYVFTAAYAGECTGCSLAINIGDRIASVSDQSRTVYMHARCAP